MIVPAHQLFRLSMRALPVRPIRIPERIYLDTVTGSDATGNGTKDAPYASPAFVMGLVAGRDATLAIRAPEAAPLRTEIPYDSTATLTIEGWDGEPWHVYGSELVSGWTLMGAGVWRSPALSWTTTFLATVMTMTETIGDREFKVKLLPASVQTQPAQKEIGFAGGFAYVRLPNDENPNNHVLELARRNSAWRPRGFGPLILKDMVARNFLSAAVVNGLSTQPANTGFTEVFDSLIEYTGDSGIGPSGRNERTICTRVRAYRCGNDGFGHHAPSGGAGYMELNGCDGSYNGDLPGQSSQGASNHETTWMVINGGRFCWNVSGGMVVINTARCDINGTTPFGPVLFDHNMRLGNTGTVSAQAGVSWQDQSTGTVTSNTLGDVTVSNGGGVGVRVYPTASVVGADKILSINNALPDLIGA